jgi:hypothetical protein
MAAPEGKGQPLVLLPFTVDGLYEQLTDMANKSVQFSLTLRGLSVPWPTQPLHLVDFGRLPGIQLDRVKEQ